MTWDSTNVARLREKTRRRHRLGRVGLYLSAIGFSLFAVFPFSWAVISMFKRSNDLYSRDNNPFWFNEPPTDRKSTRLNSSHVRISYAVFCLKKKKKKQQK